MIKYFMEFTANNFSILTYSSIGKILLKAIKPALYTIILPAISTLIVILIDRFLKRKKENLIIKKIKSETKKNKAELKRLKNFNQPIVISTLQSVQNEIFEDKINSLKGLIKTKATLFNIEQNYYN